MPSTVISVESRSVMRSLSVAHNSDQLHNKSETTQGQALEIDFEIWELFEI